jgi:hypothetical protein
VQKRDSVFTKCFNIYFVPDGTPRIRYQHGYNILSIGDIFPIFKALCKFAVFAIVVSQKVRVKLHLNTHPNFEKLQFKTVKLSSNPNLTNQNTLSKFTLNRDSGK